MEKWSCVQQAFPDGRHCLRGWGEVVNQTDTVPVCRDVSTKNGSHVSQDPDMPSLYSGRNTKKLDFFSPVAYWCRNCGLQSLIG